MIKVKGIDEAVAKLDELSHKVKSVSGKQSMSLSTLLNPEFMTTNTKFNDANEFFEKGGFEFESSEEFEQIDEAKLDEWVKENSRFENWKEMIHSASAEHIKKQIGL